MTRTARVGAAAAGLLAAIVLPATLASAAPTDPTTPAPPTKSSDTTEAQAAGVDWGPNHDGWVVEIHNDTSHDLKYGDNGPASYVKSHDNTIPAYGVGHVKGKESILPWYKNQPANMDFHYMIDPSKEWIDGDGVGLWVSANNKGNMNGTICPFHGILKCTITDMQANLPIRIDINPAS